MDYLYFTVEFYDVVFSNNIKSIAGLLHKL